MVSLESFLLNRIISDVSCGYPAGSIFYLRFQAEQNSFRVNCAWRLDNKKGTVTGWREFNEGPTSPLVLGLTQLIGSRIDELSTLDGGLLILRFNTGHVLYIFPDLTANYGDEGDSNWGLNDVENNTVYILDRNFGIRQVSYS